MIRETMVSATRSSSARHSRRRTVAPSASTLVREDVEIGQTTSGKSSCHVSLTLHDDVTQANDGAESDATSYDWSGHGVFEVKVAE